MGGSVILIPYAPRPLQKVIHGALDSHRFAVVVCHRRFGKTVLAVNQLQKRALLCAKARPRFAYIAPTYTQGKSVAWDYMKHYASVVPGHTVNESELRIDYPNGAQVRIYGADNPDSLRGIYLDGAVLDEYGLQPTKIYTEVIRPLLTDRQGWALFIGTPNGKNQFYDIVQHAKTDPAWAFLEYKASQTHIIEPTELQDAQTSMTDDEYAQEFECSFEASVKGAVFAREVQAARESGRITRVPYDPEYLVDTDWDLGFGDATAIWFSQKSPSGDVRLIDYYEASGFALNHYRRVLSDKPYSYGEHRAPHDVEQHDLGTGHTRLQVARQLGINFRVMPRVEKKEDAIHAGRILFPKCYFDAELTKDGLECLQHYRWKPEIVQNPTGKPLPVHDWASHGADAFMGLAASYYQSRRRPEAEAARAVRLSQIDRDPYDVRQPRAGRGGY